jgi:hypothetical protein
MKTESAEDLENNLIGVTVVVLAIEFVGVVFSGNRRTCSSTAPELRCRSQPLALFLGAERIGLCLEPSQSYWSAPPN